MNISNSSRNSNRLWWAAGVVTCLAVVLFVVFGLRGISFGFPLDDAWIHQTYARNLAQRGTWSFVPGRISGGSTSPLWTVLLALGYKVSESFAWNWTLAISIIALGLIVVLLGKSFSRGAQQNYLFTVSFAIMLGFEWHLNWAAASGMETLLYSLGICILLFIMFSNEQKWEWVGVILGLLLWIRPDGLTLLGPVGLITTILLFNKKINFRKLVPGFLIFALIAAAYLFFNHITTGLIFPNTFYAKQMEYRELYLTPYIQRALAEFQVLVVGPGIVVLPGFLYGIYWGIKSKDWKLIAFIAWVLGFGLIYAWRLPVTYQHGRYMIPVLPVYLFIGMLGSRCLIQLIQKESIRKTIQFAFSTFVVLITFGFYIIGILTYRNDIKTINTLMVEPAKYINEVTNPNDLIAVHDIGAMGYFSDREIVDLAGLVNPEVIPFIRDEAKLQQYMKGLGVDYFVCLADWYQNTAEWGQEIAHFSLKVDKTVKETVVLKLK